MLNKLNRTRLLTLVGAFGLLVIAGYVWKPERKPAVVGVPVAGVAKIPEDIPKYVAESSKRAAALKTTQVDIDREYSAVRDLTAFVKEHAKAAYDGDGRAQYYLWAGTKRCSVLRTQYTMIGNGNAEAGFETHIQQLRKAPVNVESFEAKERAEFARCMSFDAATAFADLPARDGGYDAAYWRQRALASRDIRALTSYAQEVSVNFSSEIESSKAASKQAAQAAIDQAIQSKDPEDLYLLGNLLQLVASDPVNGFAWQLAACQQGYDCRLDNPVVGYGCVDAGTCGSGMTIADQIQRGLGADKLGAIFARALAIQAYLNAKDYESLQPYLKLKG